MAFEVFLISLCVNKGHSLLHCVYVQRDVGFCFPYPDDENPFDERESEARDGPIASGRRSGQTKRQEEADPVEQEGH